MLIKTRSAHFATGAALALTFAGLAGAPAWAATTCSARSSQAAAAVIELYTSEGCSSCPPADTWLSARKHEPNVVALAFHVDYWDRLGWKDRFASAEFTQRQAQQQRHNGARFSYTPQVVIDGIDRPGWRSIRPSGAAPARAAPGLEIQIERQGNAVQASVTARAGAPQRLAAYWAVTENDHVTPVKAGENAGVRLRHDFVVRRLVALPAWDASPSVPALFRLETQATPAAPHPTTVNLVVLDAATQRPLQALKLAC
jgi:hypothetical protein